jgi:hypothetical protein
MKLIRLITGLHLLLTLCFCGIANGRYINTAGIQHRQIKDFYKTILGPRCGQNISRSRQYLNLARSTHGSLKNKVMHEKI